MDIERKLRFTAQSLVDVEGILRRAEDAYPFLDGPGRIFSRMAKTADRPLRIGILGEANSGKSSLANLLAGISVLPAAPLANTNLPALLKYAAKPSVTAIYESGERVAFLLRSNVAQVVAAIQDSAGKSNLPAGKSVPAGSLKLLEVGLPSGILRSVEILDLPVGRTGLPGYGMHAAIWTTVATQAWRESERAEWAKLPRSLRSRSLLAVTFCDLVAGGESDLKRLQVRLETVANPYFRGICFVANGDSDLAAAASRNKVLFVQIRYLAQQFAMERFGKAMAVAHRVTAKATAKPGTGTKSEHNSLSGHAVAEASKGLFDGNIVTGLKRPLPEDGLKKPAIPRTEHAFGAMAETAARGTAQASHLAAGGRSKERPRWMRISAVAAMAATVTLVAIQLGLIGTGKNQASNPLLSASETVEQGTMEKAETRRKAEAEAAATEARGRAVAEAAAAWERREALAEAAAAEARGKPLAEAAAEPKRMKKAEAGRRRGAELYEAERRGGSMAEAARLRSGGSGPIMHGISY